MQTYKGAVTEEPSHSAFFMTNRSMITKCASDSVAMYGIRYVSCNDSLYTVKCV